MLDKHYTFKKDTQNWPRMFIKSIEWETPIKISWHRIRENLIAKLIKKRGSLLHENLDKLLEKLPDQIVFKNQERPTIEWSKEQNSCDLLESCVRINMETVTELHSVFVCKKNIRTKIEDWFRSSFTVKYKLAKRAPRNKEMENTPKKNELENRLKGWAPSQKGSVQNCDKPNSTFTNP